MYSVIMVMSWLKVQVASQPEFSIMPDPELLNRITTDRQILAGKPIIRGHRLAVEEVLGMLAAGDDYETLVKNYPWLEPDDIHACLLYAQHLVQQVRPKLNVAELANGIPQILEAAPYITLLVLFGSRSKGTADADSDWDFAFLCDEEQRKHYEKGGWDAYRLWGILQKTYGLLDGQLDVVEMTNCSELVAHHIAKDGKILYERHPGIFNAFCEKSLISDADLREKRKQIRQKNLQMLRELKA